MKKVYIAAAALVLSLTVGAAGVWATGTDTNGVVNQSITLKVKKTKLPNKGKGQGVLLGTKVEVEDADNPGQEVPDPAEQVEIHYDDAFEFFPELFPVCDENLEGTTDQQAQDLCGEAQVGEGSATVLLPSGSGGATQVPAVVTAFNGPERTSSNGSKGPSLILHTLVPLQTGSLTTVLYGVIAGSELGGDYGQKLVVDVPPLAGGAGSIETFEADIKAQTKIKAKKKGKKKKKKKVDYVTGKCNEKTLDALGVFEYKTSPQIAVEDSVVCKKKKSKKKGKKKKK